MQISNKLRKRVRNATSARSGVVVGVREGIDRDEGHLEEPNCGVGAC